MRANKILYGLAPIVVVLSIWQLISQARIVSPTFLPPVSSIVLTLYDSLFGKTLYAIPQNFSFTIERMFLGYIISAIVAIPLGLVIGLSKTVYRLLEPTIEIFRPMPTVALIPFFILLIGINDPMYVTFVAYGCVWPILVNTIDGVKSVEPLFFDVARSIRMSRLSIFAEITFPASSPFIVSGMRISLLLALLLTIVIEMTSGRNGLGWSAVYAQQLSDVRTLYAEIFLVAVLGFVLNLVFVRLENRFMRWHKYFTKNIQ